MRRPHWLVLVGAPALALCPPGPAVAGSISISILPVVELREGALSAQVKVSSVGDEAAQSVAAVLVFGERKTRGEIHPSLAPGSSLDATLSLAVGDLGTGRWPYQGAVDYTDANQYPFQAIHLGLVTVGSPPPAQAAVSEVKADPLSSAGTLRIRLKNLAGVVRPAAPAVAAGRAARDRRTPAPSAGPHASRPRRARRRARVPRLVFPRLRDALDHDHERRRHGLARVRGRLPAGRAPAPRPGDRLVPGQLLRLPALPVLLPAPAHRDRARGLPDPAQRRLQAWLAARHVPAAGMRGPLAPLRGRAVSRARAGGARHAPLHLHGGELDVGGQHPLHAGRRVRLLARDGSRGALRGHAPAHGRHGPRPRLERAPGAPRRPGARLHAPLGSLHVARRPGPAARLVAAGGDACRDPRPRHPPPRLLAPAAAPPPAPGAGPQPPVGPPPVAPDRAARPAGGRA